MAITQIVQFNSELTLQRTELQDSLRQTIDLLPEDQRPLRYVLGSRVDRPNAVQIVAIWDKDIYNKHIAFSPKSSLFIRSINKDYDDLESLNIFHAEPGSSISYEAGDYFSAPTVEYVINYFPASLVTPEFRSQIEADFLRFYKTLDPCEAAYGLVSGWIAEEQSHADLKEGQRAKCFYISRGWDSVSHFQTTLQTEAFARALPILLAWKVPADLWHIDRELLSHFTQRK